MKNITKILILTAALTLTPGLALAHFGMIIPSQIAVEDGQRKEVDLNFKFWHPFTNVGLELAKPAAVKVYHNGQTDDLTSVLIQGQEQGCTTWNAKYKIGRPGQYVFVMEPTPYWEEAEDLFIIHYTKTYVAAFGDTEGWDQPLGLKTEIVPLSRPDALYAGNTFQGQVLVDGKPAPGVMVEVEYYPGADMKGVAPHSGLEAQTVKTDPNGVFTYAAPKEGWWGFAALTTADYTIKQSQDDKEVELGAVIWLNFQKFNDPIPLK